jgi:minor extracellular serine protease Vpr
LVNLPDGASFTLQGNDVPLIVAHFDHQSRSVKLNVIDVVSGQSLGFADEEDFFVRNSSPLSFFLFTWDGTTVERPGGKPHEVPDGAYRIELSVLKALGDPRNPAHTETWSSPPIVIARPIP